MTLFFQALCFWSFFNLLRDPTQTKEEKEMFIRDTEG
jgi:hypothetical protein